jgi:predicted outer membrane repeat protein
MMQQGISRQYRRAGDSYHGVSLSLPLVEKLLWPCFEILDAKNNSTDDALAGGGIYSQKSFSLSIM